MKEAIAGIVGSLIIVGFLLWAFLGGYAKYRETTLATTSFSPKAGVYCTQIVGSGDMAISCVTDATMPITTE